MESKSTGYHGIYPGSAPALLPTTRPSKLPGKTRNECKPTFMCHRVSPFFLPMLTGKKFSSILVNLNSYVIVSCLYLLINLESRFSFPSPVGTVKFKTTSFVLSIFDRKKTSYYKDVCFNMAAEMYCTG